MTSPSTSRSAGLAPARGFTALARSHTALARSQTSLARSVSALARSHAASARCLAALVLACGASSCVSFTYERHVTFEPISDASVASLEIGRSNLGDALARVGAPLYVWEGVNGAIVLGYGHENQREVGFDVSVPLFDSANASFRYDDVSRRLEGYVFVFDQDAVLRIVRRGLLRDLALAVRARPAFEE